MSDDRGVAFDAVMLFGGAVFGVGLALSEMARPEVVLDFLALTDLGLLAVMGAASLTFGATVAIAETGTLGDGAPLTGRAYARRLKSLNRNVLVGGAVFGVGWGLSGICPGAAYASVGVGNLPILWGVAGMFLGAYGQGLIRQYRRPSDGGVGVDAAD